MITSIDVRFGFVEDSEGDPVTGEAMEGLFARLQSTMTDRKGKVEFAGYVWYITELCAAGSLGGARVIDDRDPAAR